MTSRFWGVRLVVAGAAVLAACKSDPTNGQVGNAATVNFEFKTERVTVGDSIETFAVVRDQGGNPVSQAITITACNPAIATVESSSGAPLIQTNVKVKGIHYGTACVVATSGGLVDTLQVAALPDKLSITSGKDSVVSGVREAYTYAWLDKAGKPMTGVPAPGWAVSDGTRGVFPDTTDGTGFYGSDTGVVSITAEQSFSFLGGTIKQSYTNSKTLAVLPAAFDGTTNSPVMPGSFAVFTANPSGYEYDNNTAVYFGSTAATLDYSNLPTSVSTPEPDLAVWGSQQLFAVKGIGIYDVTQTGGSFTVGTPPLFSGTNSATSVVPAQLITVVRGASDSTFTSSSRAYWLGNRAWIVDFTADSAHVVMPPAFTTGNQLLLLTRLGATSLPYQDSLASADSLPYDQYDVVSNDSVLNRPNTGPLVTTDTTIYVTLSGSCPGGGPTVGSPAVAPSANCDDFIRIRNNGGADANITLTLSWQKSAEIGVTQDLDAYWFPDSLFYGDATFSEFCVVDGCASASSANPETSTVTVPAGATYYILVNYFNGAGRPYALAQVNITGY